MSGKSRHGKGKHRTSGRKRKTGQGLAAIAVPQPPVSQPKVPPSSRSVPAPVASVTGVRYPYIVTELRRIGILGGIMLTILVVLALVLS